MIRILTVCTGNICRSPVAERLLDRHLTAAGHDVDVRSAGTWGGVQPVSADTVRASRQIGLELTDHRSRKLSSELIATDGADLIVAMTRDHLRAIVALDPSAWPRTFTLKELARRAADTPLDVADFQEWRAAIGEGRKAADTTAPSPDDDVADPYGMNPQAHTNMVAEIDELVSRIARLLPAPT